MFDKAGSAVPVIVKLFQEGSPPHPGSGVKYAAKEARAYSLLKELQGSPSSA